MGFKDFNVEVDDLACSSPEHFNGSVATAGTPVSITSTCGRPMQNFYLEVPSVLDPDSPNAITDFIKYSLDGTNYISLRSGESIFLPANANTIYLDTNANGTTYKLIIWG